MADNFKTLIENQKQTVKKLTNIEKLQKDISRSGSERFSGLKKLAEMSKPLPLLGSMVGFVSDNVEKVGEMGTALKDVKTFFTGDKRMDEMLESVTGLTKQQREQAQKETILINEMNEFVTGQIENLATMGIKSNENFESLFKDLTREQQLTLATDSANFEKLLSIAQNKELTNIMEELAKINEEELELKRDEIENNKLLELEAKERRREDKQRAEEVSPFVSSKSTSDKESMFGGVKEEFLGNLGALGAMSLGKTLMKVIPKFFMRLLTPALGLAMIPLLIVVFNKEISAFIKKGIDIIAPKVAAIFASVGKFFDKIKNFFDTIMKKILSFVPDFLLPDSLKQFSKETAEETAKRRAAEPKYRNNPITGMRELIEDDVPAGSHRMPDGTIMKDSAMIKNADIAKKVEDNALDRAKGASGQMNIVTTHGGNSNTSVQNITSTSTNMTNQDMILGRLLGNGI
jgi:hypothetical protein|tara:strand:- start:33 stop:1415 length:1383 start_codon:yes stop_codon:yes gene_type:complete